MCTVHFNFILIVLGQPTATLSGGYSFLRPSKENFRFFGFDLMITLRKRARDTFAQALKVDNNFFQIPVSQLRQPCLKGGKVAISILEDEYLAGIESCKHNLNGQVIWPKRSTSLTIVALKRKFSPLWKNLDWWGITLL